LLPVRDKHTGELRQNRQDGKIRTATSSGRGKGRDTEGIIIREGRSKADKSVQYPRPNWTKSETTKNRHRE